MNWQMAGAVMLIFVLRVANMSLDTLRLVLVVRGQRLLAAAAGFLEALIFVLVLAQVLRDLTNIWNVLAYAGGYSGGILVGMWLEERLALGFGHVRVITAPDKAVAATLRAMGFAVTELRGQGRAGEVSVINCTVQRRDVGRVQAAIKSVDEAAFITVDEIRPLHRGFWPS